MAKVSTTKKDFILQLQTNEAMSSQGSNACKVFIGSEQTECLWRVGVKVLSYNSEQTMQDKYIYC